MLSSDCPNAEKDTKLTKKNGAANSRLLAGKWQSWNHVLRRWSEVLLPTSHMKKNKTKQMVFSTTNRNLHDQASVVSYIAIYLDATQLQYCMHTVEYFWCWTVYRVRFSIKICWSTVDLFRIIQLIHTDSMAQNDKAKDSFAADKTKHSKFLDVPSTSWPLFFGLVPSPIVKCLYFFVAQKMGTRAIWNWDPTVGLEGTEFKIYQTQPYLDLLNIPYSIYSKSKKCLMYFL